MDKAFSKKPKLVVGMSGGVDSSVAAVLLKEQGYAVIGVHMKYWSEKDEFDICENGIVNNDPSRANACCSLDSLEDARRVCAKLDIPLYVVDFKDEFKKRIVDVFLEELNAGFTPNTCVVCNRDVKFGLLLDYALSIGADGVGTGHYASVFYDETTSRYGLKKAIDERKDQSYFLSLLSQDQLSKIHLPLGEMTKDEVRAIAEKNGLVNSRRRDSQDLCFVAADYKSFVKKYTTMKPGDITLRSGEKIGTHEGLHLYTTGQRKGVATKINEPLYVYFKDFETNKLVVDYSPPSSANEILLRDFNWVSSSNFAKNNSWDFVGRYQGVRNPIKDFNQEKHELRIEFSESKGSFASGQYGVIYSGDVLIGAGKIVNI